MNSDGGGWLVRLRRRKGLVVLGSLGLLVSLAAWFLRDSLAGGSFRSVLILPQAHGIVAGTPLTYRGVEVGKVLNLNPQPQGVSVAVKIWPSDRLIPSQSTIKPLDIKGKTVLDITPTASLPVQGVRGKPLDANCDPQLILCSTERSPHQNSIRSLLQSIHLIPQIDSSVQNIDTSVQDIHRDLQSVEKNVADIEQLSDNVTELLGSVAKSRTPAKVDAALVAVERAANDMSRVANKLGRLSDTATSLLEDMQRTGTVARVNATLTSVGEAANRVDFLLAVNQNNLTTTLTNIGQTSQQLAIALRRLNASNPHLAEVQLLKNVATITTNTAELSTQLLNFSAQLNDPQIVLKMQQILDSARAMFETVNKITSDLDELTGNPKLREDLRRLIEGLSNLLSSTQLLQEQIAYAQSLKQVRDSLAPAVPTQSQQSQQLAASKALLVPRLLPVEPIAPQLK
jgi:phospholipid/cholesterol/gamma-HCH transport system substrate-binding protein